MPTADEITKDAATVLGQGMYYGKQPNRNPLSERCCGCACCLGSRSVEMDSKTSFFITTPGGHALIWNQPAINHPYALTG